MKLTRQRFLAQGGGVLAALAFPMIARGQVAAAEPTVIKMVGLPDGSDVWFDPIGLLIRPGQMVRWVNRDMGNSHTATAYHPTLFGRSRRIPVHTSPWNSDYLLPADGFTVTFSKPGVYDYYCLPHEHAGMVGRIVVGDSRARDWWRTSLLTADPNLPKAAMDALPSIAEIVKKGFVRRM
jgi:plastocyanin